MPPRNMAIHDRPPAASVYGQKLRTRRRLRRRATPSAGIMNAANNGTDTGAVG
jgi:hypothetical protein